MGPLVLTVALPVLVVLAADLWVYTDARSRYAVGRGPGVQFGALRIDTPEAWAACCLVLFVIAFPLYLVARRAAG